jgi:hypothetical protein
MKKRTYAYVYLRRFVSMKKITLGTVPRRTIDEQLKIKAIKWRNTCLS